MGLIVFGNMLEIPLRKAPFMSLGHPSPKGQEYNFLFHNHLPLWGKVGRKPGKGAKITGI